MRPQRLTARGFAAFRDEVAIDFTGTDFFALIGPTGSGKSTVIDAICFALYGSVPRYDDERVVTPVISTDATEARVELEFVSNGVSYRIVRIVRRKGAPKVQLDRLDDDRHLVDTLTSAVREAKLIVSDIVGLSFDQFTKCVVLPQGAFANFLHAKDAARNELLTSLLDLGVYDRIAALAGERQVRLEATIAADERMLLELGPADAESIAASEARLAALRALYAEIDAARAEADTLAAQIAQVRRELAAAARGVGALEAVRVAPEVRAIAAEREPVVARLRAAEEAHAAARAEVDAATALVAGSGPIDTLRAAVQAHHRIGALDETRAAAQVEHAKQEAAVDRARAAFEAAEQALSVARHTLEACRDAHAAHALAAKLVVGEPCPVCTQVVSAVDVDGRAAPAELAEAEHAVQQATREHETAQRACNETQQLLTRSATQLESLDEQRGALLESVVASPDLDAAEHALAAAETAFAALEDTRKRAGAALDEEAAARRALETFDRRVDTLSSAFHEQRDAITTAGVSGAPVPSGQLAADWPELHEWAARTAAEWRDRARASESSGVELEHAARVLVERVVEPAAGLGVRLASGVTLNEVRDVVREAGIEARHTHERLVEARDAGARLTAQLEAGRVELEVAKVLRGHLRTTNFKSWLLGRAVVALAARATERLLELSGGRYELVLGDGDDFEVLDCNNAGERRPVRSLSGGETFQASLALALALAEQVSVLSAAGASSLESIFLDEGFGTLDPEALELVAGAVETIGGEGRMVGIVTHVGALAERVPVRFRVANDGHTATVTREG